MAVKTLKVCDLCGKPADELKHNLKFDGTEIKEVCEECANKLSSLMSRIRNPPKNSYQRRKEKKAEAPKAQ
jgi:ribosome-binding protein aMBF1 (putative translation factor)